MQRVYGSTIRDPGRDTKFLQQVDLALDAFVAAHNVLIRIVGSGADVSFLEGNGESVGELHGVVYKFVQRRGWESMEDVDVSHDGIIFVN